MRRTNPDLIVHPDALWSTRSIARWSDYSLSMVTQHLINDPDFPKPVRWSDDGQPRWIAGQVMAFFGVVPTSG